MKNLIAELLVKLGEKEEESKELLAQIEALEIVVTSLVRHMAQDEQQKLIQSIEAAMDGASPDSPIPDGDSELLRAYIKKLLRHPRT